MEWTDEPRVPGGELHCRANEFQRRLGDYIIAEVYMMAESTHFIHGTSNISNFVLGLNPTLLHTDVYGR